MQANWSLVLNALLLFGVIVAIVRTLKARRQQAAEALLTQPSLGQTPAKDTTEDGIIAVRKISTAPIVEDIEEPSIAPIIMPSASPVMDFHPNELSANTDIDDGLQEEVAVISPTINKAAPNASSVMMFLLAKANRHLVGYELLQNLLAVGLRFGEGHLFHRHQYANGQGPVMCSLAAATPTGVFDMQNIGAFSVHGLCLFMHASGNATIDEERFNMMLDTARQLSEGLDAHLLDDKRQPLSDLSVQRYHSALNLHEHA